MRSSIQQFYQDCFVKFALMGDTPKTQFYIFNDIFPLNILFYDYFNDILLIFYYHFMIILILFYDYFIEIIYFSIFI